MSAKHTDFGVRFSITAEIWLLVHDLFPFQSFPSYYATKKLFYKNKYQ